MPPQMFGLGIRRRFYLYEMVGALPLNNDFIHLEEIRNFMKTIVQ